jgi:uncharacterized membrane protein
MSDASLPTAPTPDAKDYYTVMSHFYRAEVGRIMLWRQRLDLTTNWAVASVTAVTAYALGHAEVTHLVFLFAAAIVLFLLFVESRRYRYYDAFRARVRMLEAHFLLPVLRLETPAAAPDWRGQLAADLALPSFKISRRDALCRRFGRNYAWIFGITGCAWGVKIWAHCPGAHAFAGFFRAAQAGQPLPAPLFWTLAAALLGTLAWMAVGAVRLEFYSAETDIAAEHEREWQI